MQRPDPDKRNAILDVAARLFASRPFHRVKLDDVAAAAKVGKGTLYVYFAGKEQLYGALIDEGFGRVVAELRARLLTSKGTALDDLGVIVRALLDSAQRFPHLFHLMRAGQQLPCSEQLAKHRRALMRLTADVVRRGVERGELRDGNPDLTAAYLPALVRAAVLYGPPGLGADAVADHMLVVLGHGLLSAAKPPDRPARPGPSSRPERRTRRTSGKRSRPR
ncbi:MAG: TetR/AcrR family transcriptional regulator [Planctomycetota bacterium]